MLFDAIRSVFQTRDTTARHTPTASDAISAPMPADGAAIEPAALAACVLLLELAHADGEFSDAEQTQLNTILERHFALPADSGAALIAAAERERQNSVDHFTFTQQIKREYDLGQKMVLAEAMWGLVLADGHVDDHEHYLTRKISNLLDLEPGYLSAAKQAAAQRTTPPDTTTRDDARS